MKLVFMGTPEFAVVSLEKLIDSAHEILAVVTVPDKPKGRGQKLRSSPVKQIAETNSIPVLQPESLKTEEFIQQLKRLRADLFVVVAFRILPRTVFTLPSRGTLNLHASLLPRYRGAAPINWALMNGDTESGITTMLIDEKVDTGDILLQEELPLGPEMTAGELYDLLASRGADLLVETINRIEKGMISPLQQKNEVATMAPKLTREIMLLDFAQPAQIVHNKIRGLSPFPGAFCYFRGKQIKILKSTVVEKNSMEHSPGEVVQITEQGFRLQCSKGSVEILEVLPEGKKRIPAHAFVNGSHLLSGEKMDSIIN